MASVRNNRRRRRNRGRLGPLFKLLCVLAVVVALTMGATVFFRVETVAVTGNSRYTEEDVIRVSGIQIGDNLYHMNKLLVRDRLLEELPYLKALNIRRSLPSTIVITVWEWEAAARVKAPEPGAAPPTEAEGETGDASGAEPVPAAQEDWLISAGGKLLEPAPEDSEVMTVTGITPLLPRAGTQMVLPQEEQPKLAALKELLTKLEERGMQKQVSAVELGSTQVVMRYLDRFDVKMPLNSDFDYKLRVLTEVVRETEARLGDQTRGTFDLTREDSTAIYSPE